MSLDVDRHTFGQDVRLDFDLKGIFSIPHAQLTAFGQAFVDDPRMSKIESTCTLSQSTRGGGNGGTPSVSKTYKSLGATTTIGSNGLAIFTGIFLSSTKSFTFSEQAEQGSQDKTWEAIRVTSDGNQTLLGDQFAFLPSSQSAPPPTEGTKSNFRGGRNAHSDNYGCAVWRQPKLTTALRGESRDGCLQRRNRRRRRFEYGFHEGSKQHAAGSYRRVLEDRGPEGRGRSTPVSSRAPLERPDSRSKV